MACEGGQLAWHASARDFRLVPLVHSYYNFFTQQYSVAHRASGREAPGDGRAGRGGEGAKCSVEGSCWSHGGGNLVRILIIIVALWRRRGRHGLLDIFDGGAVLKDGDEFGCGCRRVLVAPDGTGTPYAHPLLVLVCGQVDVVRRALAAENLAAVPAVMLSAKERKGLFARLAVGYRGVVLPLHFVPLHEGGLGSVGSLPNGLLVLRQLDNAATQRPVLGLHGSTRCFDISQLRGV
mmetsp:Transcript_24465/g.63778  ORF Transcript_24465/g.63778 Transcript_24465/m.63778 type:complete len:236 (-) Transcript_24465:1057-1764(-)